MIALISNSIESDDETIQIMTYLAGRRSSDFMYKVLNYQDSKYKFVRCDDMADAELIIVVGGKSKFSAFVYDEEDQLIEEVNKHKSHAIVIYYSDGDGFYSDGDIDESKIKLDHVDVVVSFKEKEQMDTAALKKV